MNRRETLVESLTHAIEDDDWRSCSEHLFSLLFGLPANAQLELACLASKRYLQLFENRYPNLKWPRMMLNDLAAFVELHEGRTPLEPTNMLASDGAFTLGLTAIVIGCLNMGIPSVLTSACSFAVDSSINARMTNVWIADDPIAYQLWQKSELLDVERTALANVAAKAVGSREWRHVLDWIDTRKICSFPDHVNPEELSNSMQLWENNGRLILLPGEIKG
ncbi:MAG: hypothetical protein AB9866_15060 [Syntrophobacteraceae bacterium]